MNTNAAFAKRLRRITFSLFTVTIPVKSALIAVKILRILSLIEQLQLVAHVMFAERCLIRIFGVMESVPAVDINANIQL